MSITFECKKPTDLSAAALLARKADVDIKTAKLLIARGIDTPEKAVKFLNPSVDDLQDPLRTYCYLRRLRLRRPLRYHHALQVFEFYKRSRILYS